ncbi:MULTISPECIES: hypothetical protein [unclassified Streptomyces]|uniref:hypothetical protein n=1 Tax=Streptomyces sp. NBC_01387 TaxID=2903849 RepID=UPI002E365921|nr:hypothetical protein [Streptomyces sp. NBC_01267]
MTCENVNYIKALMALLVGQVIRPAYRRLLAQHFNFTLGQGQTRLMIDPDGFAQLEAHCDKTDRTGQCRTGAMNCVAMILLNKGGRIADITVDDSVEFAAAMRVSHRAARHVTLFYTLLFEMGILGDDAPPSLAAARSHGQRAGGPERGRRGDRGHRRGPGLAHSQKEHAAATWRKAFGHHSLFAFVAPGRAGSGEPVGALLRPGSCGWPTDAGPARQVGLSSLAVATNGRRGAG